jgi:hypothetical protein
MYDADHMSAGAWVVATVVKRVLALVFVICLCLPAGASAYSFLPKEIAEREAMVYEYLY